jgi:hypothetical protein
MPCCPSWRSRQGWDIKNYTMPSYSGTVSDVPPHMVVVVAHYFPDTALMEDCVLPSFFVAWLYGIGVLPPKFETPNHEGWTS